MVINAYFLRIHEGGAPFISLQSFVTEASHLVFNPNPLKALAYTLYHWSIPYLLTMTVMRIVK